MNKKIVICLFFILGIVSLYGVYKCSCAERVYEANYDTIYADNEGWVDNEGVKISFEDAPKEIAIKNTGDAPFYMSAGTGLATTKNWKIDSGETFIDEKFFCYELHLITSGADNEGFVVRGKK